MITTYLAKTLRGRSPSFLTVILWPEHKNTFTVPFWDYLHRRKVILWTHQRQLKKFLFSYATITTPEIQVSSLTYATNQNVQRMTSLTPPTRTSTNRTVHQQRMTSPNSSHCTHTHYVRMYAQTTASQRRDTWRTWLPMACHLEPMSLCVPPFGD